MMHSLITVSSQLRRPRPREFEQMIDSPTVISGLAAFGRCPGVCTYTRQDPRIQTVSPRRPSSAHHHSFFFLPRLSFFKNNCPSSTSHFYSRTLHIFFCIVFPLALPDPPLRLGHEVRRRQGILREVSQEDQAQRVCRHTSAFGAAAPHVCYLRGRWLTRHSL